jgi:hypothetical protein
MKQDLLKNKKEFKCPTPISSAQKYSRLECQRFTVKA